MFEPLDSLETFEPLDSLETPMSTFCYDSSSVYFVDYSTPTNQQI